MKRFLLPVFLLLLSLHASAKLPHIHSQANTQDFHVYHTDLGMEVNFDTKTVHGTAILSVKRLSKSQIMILDSEKLSIDAISGDVIFSEHMKPKNIKKSVLDEGITIVVPPQEDLKIIIKYHTAVDAPGLVWMSAEQTTSGQPMVFAMNEPIGARSWFPCQDTPAVRQTFTATIKIIADQRDSKEPLLALISGKNNQRVANEDMNYENLISDVAIPSYLFTFAAGRFMYRKQDDKIGYYADNEKTLDDALKGFVNVPRYFEFLNEKLGDNPWKTQDFLFVPPMFGYGGMEIPQLILINAALVEPTGASGYVMAHELAHMWTGNVVTNRKWNGFWLNEAWTTYWELRALRHVHKEAFARGAAFENHEELIAYNHERLNNLDNLAKSKLTTLHKKGLKHNHPEDLMDFSVYPKGSMMLHTIEVIIGTDAFDSYARAYIDAFRFKPIDTESFIDFSVQHLASVAFSQNEWREFFDAWIFHPGEYPKLDHPTLGRVQLPSDQDSQEKLAEYEQLKTKANFGEWNRFHLVALIRKLKADLKINFENAQAEVKLLKECENFVSFVTPMIDVRSQWFQLLIEADLWKEYTKDLTDFLTYIGRGRVIRPIFSTLKNQGHQEYAQQIFERNKERYFPAVSSGIENLFK